MPTTSSTRRKAPLPTAKTADPRDLYQRSVQCPEAELDFVERTFRRIRGRLPVKIREDFCGTGYTIGEWVARRKGNLGVGLDIHQPTIDWGRKHNHAKLTDKQRSRLTILNRDVRKPPTAAEGRISACDAVLAMNFSYFCFKTRDMLRGYFEAVHKSLNKEGVFFLDFVGGWESMSTQEDRRRQAGGFTYVWDQESFNPITHDWVCHIHFDFKRGPRLKKAFTYHWRLWTLPELQELLVEAGFRNPTVYWEGDNKSGRGGNGVFRPQKVGEDCPSFIAYITAEK